MQAFLKLQLQTFIQLCDWGEAVVYSIAEEREARGNVLFFSRSAFCIVSCLYTLKALYSK